MKLFPYTYKNRHNSVGFILMAMLCLSACSEFLSPNITDLSLVVNSPGDSLYTSAASITFWWEEDLLVESYRLQLVKPDFSNPSSIFDTTLINNQFSIELEEGRYKWRLRAENEESVSSYQFFSCVIDRTAPLVGQLMNPFEEDVIDLSSEPPALAWTSQDIAVDGVQFPTSDSIQLRLYDTQQILGSTYSPVEREKVWDFGDLLPGVLPGDSLQLECQIINFDPAGNRTESEWYSFFLLKS